MNSGVQTSEDRPEFAAQQAKQRRVGDLDTLKKKRVKSFSGLQAWSLVTATSNYTQQNAITGYTAAPKWKQRSFKLCDTIRKATKKLPTSKAIRKSDKIKSYSLKFTTFFIHHHWSK